jgi:hypothetical protein
VGLHRQLPRIHNQGGYLPRSIPSEATDERDPKVLHPMFLGDAGHHCQHHQRGRHPLLPKHALLEAHVPRLRAQSPDYCNRAAQHDGTVGSRRGRGERPLPQAVLLCINLVVVELVLCVIVRKATGSRDDGVTLRRAPFAPIMCLFLVMLLHRRALRWRRQ